jgi:prepilin-type N-terminal cleavage/methylation domain-containing protein
VKKGMTLIEIVIVLVIIGIAAGITMPFIRAMQPIPAFEAANSLYTLLRSAKIYTTTYEHPAAVIYSAEWDAAAIVTLARDNLSTPEREDLTPDGEPYFMPIKYSAAYIKAFTVTGETQKAPAASGYIDPGEWTKFKSAYVTSANYAGTGLVQINVRFHGETWEDFSQYRQQYYAHMFNEMGRLEAYGRELFSVTLASDDDERTATVNLYRATGRVEIKQ